MPLATPYVQRRVPFVQGFANDPALASVVTHRAHWLRWDALAMAAIVTGAAVHIWSLVWPK
jgi:hypothetical protein